MTYSASAAMQAAYLVSRDRATHDAAQTLLDAGLTPSANVMVLAL